MKDLEEKIWSVQELAEHVACTDNTIYRLIYAGKLKAFPMLPGARRKNWRIRNSSWVEYMETNETPGSSNLN